MVRVLRQVFTVRPTVALSSEFAFIIVVSAGVPPSLRPSARRNGASERERLRSCGQTDLTLLLKSMSSREGSGAKQGYMARGGQESYRKASSGTHATWQRSEEGTPPK